MCYGCKNGRLIYTLCFVAERSKGKGTQQNHQCIQLKSQPNQNIVLGHVIMSCSVLLDVEDPRVLPRMCEWYDGLLGVKL